MKFTVMYKKDLPGNMQGKLGEGNQDRDPRGDCTRLDPS